MGIPNTKAAVLAYDSWCEWTEVARYWYQVARADVEMARECSPYGRSVCHRTACDAQYNAAEASARARRMLDRLL